MKIQTVSVVCGTSACDGHCPFCVSKQTGYEQLPPIAGKVNWRNFRKIVRLAELAECTTMLFTSKGELTLYPEELSLYLKELHNLNDPFPFLELQTNGLQIGDLAMGHKLKRLTVSDLRQWYNLGLNTIAVSVVGIDPGHNSQVYRSTYPELERTVEFLHFLKYSVRLCVMMQQGMIDSFEKVSQVVDWCRKHGVAQLTVRPIRKTDEGDSEQSQYVRKYGLTPDQELEISRRIEKESTHLLTLMHGKHATRIFDFHGQNLAHSDCLTIEPEEDNIRTLIFYRNGEVTYDWQYTGARLL